MTLHNIWVFLARWKFALIPGFIIALAGGGAAFYYTPHTYTVSASYLFLSPVKDAATGASGNPFLQLGNGVSVTVDVLSVALTDGDTVRGYTAKHPDLSYTAQRDTSLNAPILLLSVTDPNLKVARSTLDDLGASLGTKLDTLQQQAQAPQTQWVTIRGLTHDQKPVLSYIDPVRNAVLAFLAVLVIVLIPVAFADRRRARRYAAKSRQAEAAADGNFEAGAPQSNGAIKVSGKAPAQTAGIRVSRADRAQAARERVSEPSA